MAPTNKLAPRIDALTKEHRNLFGECGHVAIFNAPGRINIIGEHTDYNNGYVLPVAIDISILAAATKRNDRQIRLKSMNFPETVTVSLDGLEFEAKRGWANYPLGAAWALEKSGYALQGADILFQGDIPLGSGLSSSAAIEVLMVELMLDLSGLDIGMRQIPLLCRKGENDFVGLKSGIMDQFIITLGAKDHALFLNCENLDYRLIPFVNANEVVIIAGDTRVNRELARSAYNKRVDECAEGLRILRQHVDRQDISSLSSITPEELSCCSHFLPKIIAHRCEHVVSENARVLAAVEALEKGDLATLGRLLDESHTSLKDLYEVSCSELDYMVEAFGDSEGVYGSRMTGAGFGGSAIALVKATEKDSVIDRAREYYKKKTDIDGAFYISSISDGASKLS